MGLRWGDFIEFVLASTGLVVAEGNGGGRDKGESG